jgi:hypothetical protein
MSVSGNGHFFEVRSSRYVLDGLKRIRDEEIENGRGERFLEVLRAIHDRLRKDPTSFGEPLYRLAALKLVVYVGILSPLVVQFAIHEEKPLVLLRGVHRMSE